MDQHMSEAFSTFQIHKGMQVHLPHRLHELGVKSFVVIFKVNPASQSGNTELLRHRDWKAS